jgi:hypothetical protein
LSKTKIVQEEEHDAWKVASKSTEEANDYHTRKTQYFKVKIP